MERESTTISTYNCVLVALLFVLTNSGFARAQQSQFRAGVSAIDISPPAYPVRVNGMFTERSAQEAVDPLHARSVALDDGKTRIVLCVVDTCMMARDLIDEAKAIVAQNLDLPTQNMMVSATHTHSAPSAMACLGSRIDPEYAAWLPDKLAEGMIAALHNLQPARIGWAAVDDWAHTHNRRWIRRKDTMFADPFGDVTVRAHMHPGYESEDVVGPSGPVDPGLSVLALQTMDGTPLALLANYSQHYFGSPLLSADYYGAFSRIIANRLGQSSGEGPFVAMMSQGTSGDLMWMDYGAPENTPTLDRYAIEMADKAMEAYGKIQWQAYVPLGIVEKKLTLRHRVPDAGRLAWARETVAAMESDLPRTQPDIYAHEALFLHEKQTAELKLQAIRIGDLGIATLPNEVYAKTGLRLKAQSPFGTHFNIELANGAEGYIPPPEQFVLGGYTTWPARTAGLQEDAEAQIVETLFEALEEVSGRPRKPIVTEHGPYAKAIIDAGPQAYWRLDEIAGRVVFSALPDRAEAILSGGVALYLPGAGSGTGCGPGEALQPSNFSGPNQINRAIHVADGQLDGELSNNGNAKSFAFWFWLGERSGASNREGTLVGLPEGDRLRYRLAEDGMATLNYGPAGENAKLMESRTRISMDQWHFVVLVRDAQQNVRVHVDGEPDSTLNGVASVSESGRSIRFAEEMEGKLDEIAVFDRALTAEEIAALWEVSGIAR